MRSRALFFACVMGVLLCTACGEDSAPAKKQLTGVSATRAAETETSAAVTTAPKAAEEETSVSSTEDKLMSIREKLENFDPDDYYRYEKGKPLE